MTILLVLTIVSHCVHLFFFFISYTHNSCTKLIVRINQNYHWCLLLLFDTSICFQVNIIVLDNRFSLCAPFVFFLHNLHSLQLACVYFVTDTIPTFSNFWVKAARGIHSQRALSDRTKKTRGGGGRDKLQFHLKLLLPWTKKKKIKKKPHHEYIHLYATFCPALIARDQAWYQMIEQCSSFVMGFFFCPD